MTQLHERFSDHEPRPGALRRERRSSRARAGIPGGTDQEGRRSVRAQLCNVPLRTFPRDGHARFVDAVANGKRNMPAWDDVLDPEQIEALWAYVIAGETGE